ncbi:MAG: SpoIIE family protein phosphatase [Faecalibacterium sp.]|jgi:stage II sporulation protein E|nr:SpoIIE family protein phosphatase [Faecalibacterium sp.]
MQTIKWQLPKAPLRLKAGGASWAAFRQGAAFCLGAAACAGRLYGLLTPFGVALALGAGENDYIAAAAGAAVGTLLWQNGPCTVATLCTLAAVAAVRRLQPRHFPDAAAACIIVQLAMTGLLLASGAADADQMALACCNAGLAVLTAWLMRQLAAYTGGAQLLVPGMIVTAVLANISAGPFLPGISFAAGACIALACRGRREQALVAAAGLCLTLCAADPALTFAAAAILGGTVVAVSFGAGQRLRCGVLFLLGCMPGMFCAATVQAALRMGVALAVAEGAFCLMPQKFVLAVPDSDPAESAGRPAVSAAATKLSAVAESLSGIAQTVNGVYRAMPKHGETYNWVAERTHDMLCAHCAKRESCWQESYSDTLDGLFSLKPKLEQQGHVDVEDLPGQFACCIHPAALCAAETQAWAQFCGRRQARVQADALRTALTEQYDAVASALAALSEQLGEPGLREDYKTGRVAALFASLGMEPGECAVTQDSMGRTRAAVTLPRKRFSEEDLVALSEEVSRICHRSMDPPQKLSCRGATTLLFLEKPALQASFGMATQAASGNVSGDAVQQFCTGDAAFVLLCDGMGTGRPAAVDGHLAAELTARLLRAGFAPETAARLINVALTLKSDEESGATLDLLQVDLYGGAAALFKAGAAPGFVIQAGRASKVSGPGLPIGILGAVSGQTKHVHLEAGDWAVLVSDGMLLDGPEWILQQLQLSAATDTTPQALAELLVKMARARAEHTGRPDDITAAVIKLEKYR